MNLTNRTIANNQAGTGIIVNAATVTLRITIVAQNTGGAPETPVTLAMLGTALGQFQSPRKVR